MKKMIALFSAALVGAVVLGTVLAGCKKTSKAESATLPAEITVFAAASMTEAMNEIADLYQKEHPEVKIVYNFDSSGTLKTQITEGAPCDIFISAGQQQMNQIDPDFVVEGSRFNIVSNKVVLVVPRASSKGISSFNDAASDKVSIIALGNSDVPVGQYSKEIFTNLGMWDALESSGKITFGSNVKEVLSHVESGAADCGIVYGTDAASSKGVSVAADAPSGSHKPITYPAAIIKNTSRKDAAQAAAALKAAEDFSAFLKGGEAQTVFERIGFARP